MFTVILDGQGSLQAQLTRALRQGILGGRFASGSRLPATRWLASTSRSCAFA